MMMQLSRFGSIWILVVGVLLSRVVCATTYPESEKISMYTSAGTVSTWTETSAEDYLVPSSQVFITGRGLGAAKGLGLLGVFADRMKNSATASAAEPYLHLNFARALSSALRMKIADRPYTQKFVQVESDNEAQLILLPSAKLTVSEDGNADLSFRLTVRIRSQQSGTEKRDYFYRESKPRPLTGSGSWSENESAALLDSADTAMAMLSDTLLDAIESDTVKDWSTIREAKLAKLGGSECGENTPKVSAETYFRRGKTLMGLSRYVIARECFMRAQEEKEDSNIYRESCAAIGTMYELGWGVEKNMATAMLWFTKAGL